MPHHPTVILSPSLLSADFGRLYEEMDALEAAGIPWAHLDVMDGNFVPNITFGPPIIKALRKRSSMFFDVHLMIEEPDRHLEAFVDAGADLVCVHAETCVHLERTCSEIARLGAKPAVALNPHTPLEVVEYLLPQLYMVLTMSVNPGFGGQRFLPFALKKVRALRGMMDKVGSTALLQVDGGVTPENIGQLVMAGADVFVSGSAFFSQPPYAVRHRAFLEAAGAARAPDTARAVERPEPAVSG